MTKLDPGIKMIGSVSERVYVANVSLSDLEDAGHELVDNRDMTDTVISELQSDWYKSKLTNRQKAVAQNLIEGYSRKETAARLNVSLQAIHQIVIRMRNRLSDRTGLFL